MEENILKEMYKKLPKKLLFNKWDLNFILSKDVYDKQKHLLYNDRFLGISVEVCEFNAMPKDYGVLSFSRIKDFYYGRW